ncbi:MAG: glucosamine-6-phosphate deaminase [Planctomycetota bacterium]|nr:MAG: glucosamine-6-phosphate deaminase [Planctomycetota bacterium]
MRKLIFETKQQLGKAAAKAAADRIRNAIETKGSAKIILATGASQFETLAELVNADGVEWSTVTMFHLDEYIGLGPDHPASFRKYLKERFLDKVAALRAAHFVKGDAVDPQAECDRLNRIIADHPIDLALVGIGENGHLAFNDPPADFDTHEPYIVVNLDDKCRNQQLGEGWFEKLNDVPTQAISMSIRQIIRSSCIIASVPDRRKARAVKDALEGPVTNTCPASSLQDHPNCKIFLDRDSASLLSTESGRGADQ